MLHGAVFPDDFIGFRFVVQAFVERVFQIGEHASFPGSGEFQADKRIESDTACAEKRVVVYPPVIYAFYVTAVDVFDGFLYVHGYPGHDLT